jgi:hypothetical protein
MNVTVSSGQNLAAATGKSLQTTRTLKIELLGDLWRGKTFSGIRLKGRWLTAAGFPAGRTVMVSVVSPGVLELRVLVDREDPESRHAQFQVQGQSIRHVRVQQADRYDER